MASLKLSAGLQLELSDTSNLLQDSFPCIWQQMKNLDDVLDSLKTADLLDIILLNSFALHVLVHLLVLIHTHVILLNSLLSPGARHE